MRAAYYERTGAAAEVLQFGELPDPTPGPGEVRVKLAWSGINPSDVKSRAGLRSSVLPFPRIVPHSDGAGMIDAVGSGVDAARRGERVWIWNGAWGRPFGTAAPYIVVPAAQAVRLPDAVDLAAGACLGIPALTAYHAVTTRGGVAGQHVLIAGGAGAVGHYAIQIAKQKGATRVLATVSNDEKAALARAAGADIVLNYRSDDLAARVAESTQGRGVDRIVEVDFAANADVDFALIRTGGDIVVYGSGAPKIAVPFAPAIMKNVGVQFFIVYHLWPDDRRRAVEDLTALLAANRLTHNIGARLPLDDIVAGHQLVEAGTTVGNVVLEVR